MALGAGCFVGVSFYMEGWIKLHRKLQENALWTCEPFTRGQAWVDLILLANHKYGYFYKRGVKIEVQRGQVGVSEVGLSKRWSWSRSKVRKFLNDLEKEQQIIQHKSNVTQLITLVKYDEYQEKEQQTEQQKNSRKTAEEQQKDTNKNDKKDKNEKNNIPPLLENVIQYCIERDKNVDANKWYNFYQSKGWMIGKNKMKDWKAAVRTWEKEPEERKMVL